jgi:hypothetical protein
VSCFFTTRSSSLVFFTTCSSFHSFYGKSYFIFMHSSSLFQFTTFIGFFFHFHMFKFTPPIHYPHSFVFFHFHVFKFTPLIHYPHSLFFFQFEPCNCATIKIIVFNEFSPFNLHLQELVFLCFEVESQTMRVMTFLIKDFLVPDARLLVESVWNDVVLHHFRFFCNFNLMMMKEVGNWVKY